MALEWKATNAPAIQASVGQLRTLMEEGKLRRQDALKLNNELLGAPQGSNGDFAGWTKVKARLIKTKAGHRLAGAGKAPWPASESFKPMER
jgi:hypothetical protein